MRPKGEIFRVAAVLAGVKAAYLLLVILAVSLFSEYDNGSAMNAMMRWPRSGNPVFDSHFATWDAAHYLFLSEVGYKSGVPSCAFYPLWPLAIRGFSPFTGGNHVISAMVLANIFSFIAWILFYFLVKDRYGDARARLAIVFLILFPGSLFFQFAYTESLFFLLIMLLWWGLEKNQPLLVACGALLLPMTRAIGIFCILPIFWSLFGEALINLFKKRLNQEKKFETIGRDIWPIIHQHFRQSWLLLMPLFGWTLYLLFMEYQTGNAFEGFEAQRFWGAHSILNIINVPKFLMKFVQVTDFHSFYGSILDRCVFLLLFWSLFQTWKLGKDMLVWTLILGIVPAMSGDLVSFTRFCSIAFPLFIALAAYISEKKWAWLQMATLEVFAILHLVLVWRFVNFHWAG
jgi:hypothetical protein